MKRLFIFFIFQICLAATVLAGDIFYFPELSNLRDEYRDHHNKLILVLVSQKGCVPCKVLSNKIIKPIEQSKEYRHVMVVREISMDEGKELIDENGNKIPTKKFLGKYDVVGTPTLLFLDNKGNSLHPPMFGLGTLDYYSYYVEKAIDQSVEQITKPNI